MAHLLSATKMPCFLRIHSGGIALLIVYVFTFTLSSPNVPHEVHDHHEHATAEEHDPCHISIFHPGAKGGCSHKYHLTENCPDCHKTDVTLVRKIVTATTVWMDIPFVQATSHNLVCEKTFFSAALSHRDRGPPSM